jgi:hypothetical protein
MHPSTLEELKAKGWIIATINGEQRAHNPDIYPYVYVSITQALAGQTYYERH